MIVVGYYTNKQYRAHALKLQESARTVGLMCMLYSMPHLKGWGKNVYHKPDVILKAMDEHPTENIIYCDVDAEFVSFPALLSHTEWEVAAYFDTPTRPVGGTVFFQNSPRGRKVVEEWKRQNSKSTNEPDDFTNLRIALSAVPHLNVGYLPPGYVWGSHMRRRFPTAEVVIEHFSVGDHTYDDPKEGL